MLQVCVEKVEEALNSGAEANNIRLKRLSGRTLLHEDDISAKVAKAASSFGENG